MQLEKKLSAEKELIASKIEALEKGKADILARLTTAKELLSKAPWDAERAHDVEELEHQLSVAEFNIETLKKQL